ncbi:hypothetical protein V6N13_006209 [Hibiscus sabdariffa]
MTKGMSQQRQRVLPRQKSRLSSRSSFDALFVLGYSGKYSDQIAIPFVFFFSASAENLGRQASTYQFPYSLRDKAIEWLNNLPPGSLQSWTELCHSFLAKFSYTHMTDNLRNQITSFRQEDDEAMHEA